MENRAWAETACADPLGKGTVGGSCLSRYHEWRGDSGGDPDCLPKYLRFDGTAHAKTPLTLHFGERWAPLLTKLFSTEMVRTDDLAIGRSAAVGENGMVRASNALRSHLRSNERETEDRDYVERCFGRSLYAPKELALMEQRDCTGNHLGCHLWFTRGEPSPDKPVSADAQRLFNRQRSRPSETGPLTSKTATSIKAPSCD